MRQVSVGEARTHLSRLLRDVELGETVVITRNGRPLARLVPVTHGSFTVQEAIEAIREFRRHHSLGGLKIKDLIEEGQRY